jgi:hypothetical protein
MFFSFAISLLVCTYSDGFTLQQRHAKLSNSFRSYTWFCRVPILSYKYSRKFTRRSWPLTVTSTRGRLNSRLSRNVNRI